MDINIWTILALTAGHTFWAWFLIWENEQRAKEAQERNDEHTR